MQWCSTCNVEVAAEQRYCGRCGSLPTVPPLPDEPPPAGVELEVLHQSDVSLIYALSTRLRAAHIKHWITHDRGDDSFSKPRGDYGRGIVVNLVVQARDVERAERIKEEEFRATVPDIPEGFSFASDGSRCPACSAPLMPDAIECGDCGLSFAGSGS